MSTCPNCFRYNLEVNCYKGAKVCAYCGYAFGTKPKEPLLLPPETILNKRYFIGTESINDGTYEIYRACDIRDKDREVTVWELLPQKLEKRMEDGNISFSDEEMQRKFQKSCDDLLYKYQILKRPDIWQGILVPLDSFKENGTAYIVTEAITGDTLLDYRNGIGGRLSKKEAFTIMLPIIKSIDLLNKYNVKHGNVRLNSMYFTQNGKIKLGTFGKAGITIPDTDKTNDINDVGISLLSLIVGGAEAQGAEKLQDEPKNLAEDKLTAFGLNKNEAVSISAVIYTKDGRARTGELKKLITYMERARKESCVNKDAEKYDKTISITKKQKVPLVWVGIGFILIGLSIIGLLFASGKISPVQAETQETDGSELPEETKDPEEADAPELPEGERRAEEAGMPEMAQGERRAEEMGMP